MDLIPDRNEIQVTHKTCPAGLYVDIKSPAVQHCPRNEKRYNQRNECQDNQKTNDTDQKNLFYIHSERKILFRIENRRFRRDRFLYKMLFCNAVDTDRLDRAGGTDVFAGTAADTEILMHFRNCRFLVGNHLKRSYRTMLRTCPAVGPVDIRNAEPACPAHRRGTP